MQKTAILVTNLGTPKSPSRKDVKAYLKQFLLDYRVIDLPYLQRQALVRGIIAPFRSKPSAASYKEIWNEQGSPLLFHSLDLVNHLNNCTDSSFKFFLGMRYQEPCMISVLDEIKQWNPDKIILFPLYPQYASATTGSTFEQAFKVLSNWNNIPSITTVAAYYDQPSFIQAWIDRFKLFDISSYDHILFSFHGLPQAQLIKCSPSSFCLKNRECCKSIHNANKSCYSAQCYQTASLIAKELNLPLEKSSVSFQSRLGRKEWTQPYTTDVLCSLASQGKKKILISSPAFTADCLETIFELGIEYKELFLAKGGQTLDLVPSLNSSSSWVKAVLDILEIQQTTFPSTK